MMTKEKFHKDKLLRNWWHTIVEDPRFEEVKLYVRSAVLDGEVSSEQLQGAKLYELMLVSISEADDTGEPLPGPGLYHEIDKMPDKPAPEEKKNANANRPQSKRAK